MSPLSIFAAFSDMLVSCSSSRTRRRSRPVDIQFCDVLEYRKLLSVVNSAPELTSIVVDEAFLHGLVTDDGTYGMMVANVDVGSDGNVDFVLSTYEGDTLAMDFSSWIPANETRSVTIELVETNPAVAGSGSGSGSSEGGSMARSSVTVQVPGITLDAIQISEIVANEAVVIGAIDNENANIIGEVRVDWRVAGETVWNTGDTTNEDGIFSFYLPNANGETDFEFVAVHTAAMSQVFGDVVLLEDISGEPNSGSGGSGSGGSGSSGSGSSMAGASSGSSSGGIGDDEEDLFA